MDEDVTITLSDGVSSIELGAVVFASEDQFLGFSTPEINVVSDVAKNVSFKGLPLNDLSVHFSRRLIDKANDYTATITTRQTGTRRYFVVPVQRNVTNTPLN